MSKELVHYDTMRRAIDAAHSIDEILPIRHKAAQLAAAAKIAKDFESERKCRAIRVRAERRAGELLADIPKAPGPGRGKKTPHDAESFHKAPSEPVSIKIEPVFVLPKRKLENSKQRPAPASLTNGNVGDSPSPGNGTPRTFESRDARLALNFHRRKDEMKKYVLLFE
jgi:hypothetical protein